MPKRKFMLIHRHRLALLDELAPGQTDDLRDRFAAWKERFADCIVDTGAGLAPDGKVVTAAGVTDGPYIETKELIGGYIVVEVLDIHEAVDVARESPGAQLPGSSIEVRPVDET